MARVIQQCTIPSALSQETRKEARLDFLFVCVATPDLVSYMGFSVVIAICLASPLSYNFQFIIFQIKFVKSLRQAGFLLSCTPLFLSGGVAFSL